MVCFHQKVFLSLQNKPFLSKKPASPFCQHLLRAATIVEAIHIKVAMLQKKKPHSDKYINWSFTKTCETYQGRFREWEENTHLSSNKLL